MVNLNKIVIRKDDEVVLRELCDDDIQKLAEYANNEKVSINLRDGFPNPYTVADAKQFIDMANSQNPKTIFAIEFQGEYVGNISLFITNGASSPNDGIKSDGFSCSIRQDLAKIRFRLCLVVRP